MRLMGRIREVLSFQRHAAAFERQIITCVDLQAGGRKSYKVPSTGAMTPVGILDTIGVYAEAFTCRQ